MVQRFYEGAAGIRSKDRGRSNSTLVRVSLRSQSGNVVRCLLRKGKSNQLILNQIFGSGNSIIFAAIRFAGPISFAPNFENAPGAVDPGRGKSTCRSFQPGTRSVQIKLPRCAANSNE